MKRSFFFILGFHFALLNLSAQDNLRARNIADEILSHGKAYENLRYLCKDIGPRLSGSANAAKAVDATARMLREAGADTVYLQPCMVPHWERGVKETGYLQAGNDKKHELRLCALGSSVGTGAAGAGGEVVEVKSFDALEALRDKVKGKIIFFNFVMSPTYINTFRAYGEAGAARRIGPALGGKFGAAAVMVRSLSSNVDEYPHTGNTRYNDSFPMIPAVAISTADAEWLSKKLALGTVQAWFKTNCRTLPDVQSYNVIGEMRGSPFPEQIVTVGGHLDSWDLGEGAHDDGAGIVQSIEIIRTLNALSIRPQRTIRAVMFMNEENGLKGGEAYLKSAKSLKEQHVFALESDAGGFTPRGFSFDIEESKFAKVAAWKDLFYPYGVYEFTRGGGGADIGALKEVGAALAGLSPDSQRYFDLHHASTDVFETVNQRELHLGAVNMAILVWLVSEYGL